MDMITVFLAVGACVLVSLPTYTDASVMCYQCDGVIHPRDCHQVVQCAEGEACSVKRYEQANGTIYYNSGCLANEHCHTLPAVLGRKRDTVICQMCCNGEYCNKESCDVHSQRPRCLECDTVEDPALCTTVAECNIGEKCYTQEKLVAGETRYQLGCASSECVPRTKRATHLYERQSFCRGCCFGENCNRELCNRNDTTQPTKAPSQIVYNSTTPATAVTTIGPGCIYKGQVYRTGESWDHGCQYQCTCMDDTGKYACKDLCPKYLNVPNECKMVIDDGACCPHPDCSGTNITQTNFSMVNVTGYIGLYDCTYEGQHYKQNETWRDGCEWECTCVDSQRGYYKCNSLCYTWDLPPACHLEPAAPGKCCQTPSCPLGYKINYPPGYVVN